MDPNPLPNDSVGVASDTQSAILVRRPGALDPDEAQPPHVHTSVLVRTETDSSTEPLVEPQPNGALPTGVALGLVMGGGGARAAYQVGFLRCLARCFPELIVPYVTGVSAGAINAAHLAAHHGTFQQAVEELTALWRNLTIETVFRVDARSLLTNVGRWGLRVAAGVGRRRERTGVRALVDTSPLRSFLTEVLHAVDGEITGIGYNLARGKLRAVALSGASYSTGRSVTWVQGEQIPEWERPNRISQNTTLKIDHVMASASLPLFFPAVRIEGEWYGDGGMRLATPLSPAIHLGATKIIAISTRYARSHAEASEPLVSGYPPPAQVLGVLLNSVFLDHLDQDAFRLNRLNRILEKLPPEERNGLRPVRLLTLRPSRDLGKLANEYEPQLPKTFRFLTRNLGTRETVSPDSLSMLMFQPDYLARLIEIGEQDAEERADEIREFVRTEAVETP